MSTGENFWQELQFCYRKINFKRRKNGVNERALSSYTAVTTDLTTDNNRFKKRQ